MKTETFERIIQIYGRDILRFCRITAGNREEGDDLYQETMLRLLEHLDRLEEGESVKSYCLSTAVLLWKNKKRKFARRMRLAPTQSLEQMTEDGPEIGGNSQSPEELVVQESELAMIRQITAALPEKYKLPLAMYYSANMQIGEIAQILGIPEATVKTRLKRAKEKIRKEFLANER